MTRQEWLQSLRQAEHRENTAAYIPTPAEVERLKREIRLENEQGKDRLGPKRLKPVELQVVHISLYRGRRWKGFVGER